MLSPVVNDTGSGGLMSLNVRPHWARVTLVKSLFLLDNCPSFFSARSHTCPQATFFVLFCLKFNNYACCHVNEYLICSSPPSMFSLLICQAPEQDEVLQSIDRAIEGIHNVALKNGGKYNLEQRDVLQWVENAHDKCQIVRCCPLCPAYEWFFSSVAENWSITERRPSHGEVPPPPVINKASHLPTVKYLSVKLLLHPMALTETMDDREACRYQEAWIICKENRAFTR